MTSKIVGDMRVTGQMQCDTIAIDTASITGAMLKSDAAVPRTKLQQDADTAFALDFRSWRVHDAITSFLPSAAAADDLALDGDTFGTGAFHITAGDVKTTSSTRYARFPLIVPAEYDEGETLTVRFSAGMLTTVADGSCTLDLSAYLLDRSTGIGSDLVSTAAQSMNSVTFANLDFLITPTGIVAGDVFDCRVAIAYVDTATATVVEPAIAWAARLVDVKG